MSSKPNYTNYPNKIGLFLTESDNIELSFPYKDCVLEAGMTKEDAKRPQEYFLHEERDALEISTLFAPKSLTNFKKIDQNSEKNIDNAGEVEFWDEDGNLKQNLLIKGNNLVALHSINEKLAGKVKLIYIDPPYNTGNDGFSYNDRYSHSTWLTFMKNRLEIAKELLREDGVIFVQCGDLEGAYLKILMDEIFGRENFISTITRVTKKGGNKGDYVKPKTDYIFLFFKNKERINKDNYGFFIKKEISDAKWIQDEHSKNDDRLFAKGEIPFRAKLDIRPNQRYYMKCPDGSLIIPPGENFPDLKKDGEKVTPKNDNDKCWTWTLERYLKEKQNNRFYFYETNKSPFLNEKGEKSKWSVCKKIFQEEFSSESKDILSSFIEDSENSLGTKEVEKFSSNFSFPKPEKLLWYIIESCTQHGDLVLDYHLGSGTTAAVAHKMGRRWIGIEQMDYIDTIAKECLKKVIDGEQGGISKSVNWQGGGDFVYFELKTFNEDFLRQIDEATSKETLNKIYQDMKRSAFLKFFFNAEEFENEETEEGKIYKQLPLAEQKEKLKGILDMNHLYLNADNDGNTVHDISELDKSLTAKFYDHNTRSA